MTSMNLSKSTLRLLPTNKGNPYRLPPLPTVRDLIKLYKLRALRQLSQNFLLDQRITDKIVKTAGKISGSEVCEVGPGPGSITRSILNRNPAKVIVIEKDPRFLTSLQMLEDASPIPLKIILGDVMSFNMEKMFEEDRAKAWTDRPPSIHIVGNLPFNVSTHLIIRWLHAISERRNAWKYGRVKMTLTFQKEVAERMVAPILTKQRCRLSIMTQNWCHVNHAFTIPGKAFVPKPDVDVGVVCFEPLVSPVIDLPFKLIEKVVRSIFAFRQKYCIRGVEKLFPPALRSTLAPQCLMNAGVNPQSRPLQLTLPEVGRICWAYHSVIEDSPKLARYNHREQGADDDDYLENLSEDSISL